MGDRIPRAAAKSPELHLHEWNYENRVGTLPFIKNKKHLNAGRHCRQRCTKMEREKESSTFPFRECLRLNNPIMM